MGAFTHAVARHAASAAALVSVLAACEPAQPAAPTAAATTRSLEELVRTAGTDLGSLRTVMADPLVLRTTAPESGAPVAERKLRAAALDERAYHERILPLFVDLHGGAPLRCDDATLSCVVTTQSSAEIEYRFERRQGEPRLTAICAPAYE